MADESPQVHAKSPLIQSSERTEDMSGAAAAVVNGLKSQKENSEGIGWKLRYKDFAPSKKGNPNVKSSFKELVERANDWLHRNTDQQLLLCETITWMESNETRLGDTEKMVNSKPILPGMKTHLLRGLRLWLVPSEGQEANKSITYFDVVPDKGETIQSLTEKLNRRLEEQPLKGRLLNVQTVSAPHKDYSVDNEILRWSEGTEQDSPRTFLLRVFSLEDKDSKSAMFISLPFILQIRDFVPKQTDDGYEGFEQLVENANTWLKDQSDVRMINIQSVLAPKLGNMSHTGNHCFYILPGCASEAPADLFRILRVVYTKLHQKQPEGPAFYPFYFETFMPQMIPNSQSRSSSRKEHLEKMRDVCLRADEFLSTTGTEIICCESVLNPMNSFEENSQGQVEDMNWLVTVRLITAKQKLPPLNTAVQRCTTLINSETLKNKGNNTDDQPVEHPGPIFLGNVVNRPYRYRWVIVGVVAVIMMTIIVVISVLYANK